MGKTVVSADIYRTWLNCRMSRVQASPVAAQMTQVPASIYETIFLPLGQLAVDELGNNAVVENNGVFALSILPSERFLKFAYWTLRAISRNSSWRRGRM